MRNKASLVLMEQLVMILVLALASAVCLSAFVRSDQISRETEQKTQAAFACQSVAETVKAAGNVDDAARQLGAEKDEHRWILAQDGFLLAIQEEESGQTGLGKASVQALAEEKVLFSLTVGWQEVAP